MVPISGSLKRSRSMASSSSRNARSAQRRVAGGDERLARRRLWRRRARDGELADALGAIDACRARTCSGCVSPSTRRVRADAARRRAIRRAMGRARPAPARASATASLNWLVGQTLSTSRHSTARLPLHALGERAEDIRQIAPHLALVDDARQAAGAGQHAKKRRFGQATDARRHRRRGRSRRRPAPARSRRRRRCRSAPRGTSRPLVALASSMPRRVSLVNLQKFTLKPWRRRAEHEDVGAGAEDPRSSRLVSTTA